jgi:streptogramin lyase
LSLAARFSLAQALAISLCLAPVGRAVTLEPGDLVVVDRLVDGVLQVDPASGERTVVSSDEVGTGIKLFGATEIALDLDGSILVADDHRDALFRIDPATGNRVVISGLGVGEGTELRSPLGVAVEPDGSYLIGDRSLGAVMHVDRNTGDRSIVSGCSHYTCPFLVGDGPTLLAPRDIALEPNGDILVVDDFFLNVFRVDRDTGDRTIISGFIPPTSDVVGVGPNFVNPNSIALEADGSILVTDGLRVHRLIRIDPITGERTSFSGCVSRDIPCSVVVGDGPDFGAPTGIALEGDGSIVVVDSRYKGLFRVDPISGDRTLITGCASADSFCTVQVGEGTLFRLPRRVAVVPVPMLMVEIDIKPGSDPAPINPFGRGVIPVAILGSDTFDVEDVDVTALAFGPAGAAPAHKKGGHFEDVDADGVTDLVSHYRTQETGVAFGGAEACVTGETVGGAPFEGCDAIVTAPPCGSGVGLALLLPAPLWLLRRRRSNSLR